MAVQRGWARSEEETHHTVSIPQLEAALTRAFCILFLSAPTQICVLSSLINIICHIYMHLHNFCVLFSNVKISISDGKKKVKMSEMFNAFGKAEGRGTGRVKVLNKTTR
jgi:hypothetical protein